MLNDQLIEKAGGELIQAGDILQFKCGERQARVPATRSIDKLTVDEINKFSRERIRVFKLEKRLPS